MAETKEEKIERLILDQDWLNLSEYTDKEIMRVIHLLMRQAVRMDTADTGIDEEPT